jgi:hypothetical protein
VRVHFLTLSFTPKLPSWLATLQALVLVTSPRLGLRHPKRGSWLKPKELKINNNKSIYGVRSLKLLDNYNIVGLKTNLLPSMKVHYKPIGKNQINEANQQPIILEQVVIKKILEEIIKDIIKEVLETKYKLNLGQLLRLIPNIKHYIFNPVPSKPILPNQQLRQLLLIIKWQ